MAKQKWAKTDYDIANLPANRRQVFLDVYKNRLGLIVDLGLLMLLFSLPMAAVNMLMLAQGADIHGAVTREELTAAEAAAQIMQIRNAGNLMHILTLSIFALGLAGGANVVKNLVWQEGVLFKSDFWTGIRSNGLAFVLTAAAAGILSYAGQYLLQLRFFEKGTALELGMAAIFAAGVLAVLTVPFVLVQATLYRLNWLQLVSNGFLLAMRSCLPTAAVVIGNILPFLLLLTDNYTVYIFAMLLLPVLAVPALMIADTLYVHSVLDKYINRENFPQIYRKGLTGNADHPD